MKPKLIFYADIVNEEVKISFWNLDNPKNELMPISLLKKQEINNIFWDKINTKNIKFVPEDKIKKLKMRKKILKTNKKVYKRR